MPRPPRCKDCGETGGFHVAPCHGDEVAGIVSMAAAQVTCDVCGVSRPIPEMQHVPAIGFMCRNSTVCSPSNRKQGTPAEAVAVEAKLPAPQVPQRGRSPNQEKLFSASGKVEADDPVVDFLYTLMRDRLTPGVVGELVREAVGGGRPSQFTNGFLAQYAKWLAAELRRDP